MEHSTSQGLKKIKAGQLLLAEPFMADPYFNRSVILLCEHNAEGSLGFIINKPLDIQVNDLLQDFPSIDLSVCYGGPVQVDTIHFLHNLGDLLEESVPILPGIYWGGSFEKLKFLVDNQLALSTNIRFFVGYSGWTEGQLQEEMKFGSWLHAEADSNYIFKDEPGQLWQRILDHKGDIYSVLARIPESNLLN